METLTLEKSIQFFFESKELLEVFLRQPLISTILSVAIHLLVIFFVIQFFQILLLLLSAPHGRTPYSRPYKDGKKILIVGDSTAAGTGALTSEYTIAGRLALNFPRVDILNIGVNGSTTQGALDQLKTVQNQYFDLIIIITGGNDVWSFTSSWKLKRILRDIFTLANKMSNNKTILLFFGNNGSAEFVPFIFRGLFLKRTVKIQNVFNKVATDEGTPLVELFTTNHENPFLDDPRTYFAKDGMHPSDLGYHMWYKKMWDVIRERNIPVREALEN